MVIRGMVYYCYTNIITPAITTVILGMVAFESVWLCANHLHAATVVDV